MRSRLFIIAIFLLVAVGFTSTSFAVNPVVTQLEQHDADMTTEHGELSDEHSVLDTKIEQVLSSVTPSIPQPIQREFNAGIFMGEHSVEAGRFTVPSNNRLVIELITLQVLGPDGGNPYQVLATTSIGTNTVEHPIGTIIFIDGMRRGTIAGILESFPRIIYADPDTDVVFTVIGNGGNVAGPVLVKVTFSGRLIDVP